MTTVLFDLDGTLTNPFEGMTRCHQYALHELGVQPVPTQAELARHIGPPLRRVFAELLGESATKEDIERAVAAYRERMSRIGLFENVVYPGVETLLAALTARRYRMFVATSKIREYAQRILRHFALEQYFVGVYGAEPDGRFDDKGELVAHLLVTERLAPEATLMVGDRRHDVDAAKQNGLRAIGVSWGFGSVEELMTAGADAVCDRPEEVLDAVDRVVHALVGRSPAMS